MDSPGDVEDVALREAVDASMDGIAVLDEAGDYRYVNEAHARTYGVDDPEEMVGWNWRRLYHDEEVDRLEGEAFPALESDGEWRGEAVGRRVDGESFRQELSLATVDDGGLVCVVRDVSDRARERRELRRRQERLTTILEHLPVVLFALDPDGTFTLSKGTALTSLGLSPDEAVGHSVFDVYEGQPELLADCERALSGERVNAIYELGERYFETVYEPVFDDGDLAQVIGVSLDVTDRERYRERLGMLHDATRDLAYADSKAEVVARVVETAEEVIDRSLVAFFGAESDDDRLHPIELSTAAEQFSGGDPDPITPDTVEMAAFEDGETRVVDDYQSLSEPTSSDAPLRTTMFVPVGDHGLLGVTTREVRDVPETERRLFEVLADNAAAALDRAARERQIAEQRDRTEFLNSLLRHELVNDLQVVDARLAAVVDAVPEPYVDDVRFARDWCDEATEFIERVRTVLEAIIAEDHTLEPVDVARVVSETVAATRDRYPRATLEADVPDDPAVVAADDTANAVVGNVVLNAVEHHDGDDPWVRVGIRVDEDTVTVRVEDDGPGLPDGTADIFERGETTDPDGGSGFGLYFVDVMMDKYGGHVDAWNREGEGAAFELVFDRI